MLKRVVIAGGGTAGWLTAAALAKQFGEMLDITLVESDEIGIVGVGEATFPSVQGFHRLLGLDEAEFMRATQATFKLGISFEDWGAIGDRYMHAFGTIGRSTWMGDFQHFWLAAVEGGFGGQIGEYCFEHMAALAGKFSLSDSLKINYAYQFDAGLYAKFLRQLSEAKGVKRKEGKIREVQLDSRNGHIRGLLMESGESVEGDLFVDCTGFRALLVGETLGVGYEDYSRWLRADRALAVQTPGLAEIPPFTRATARQSGWQWRIPLQHRVGNGLVFCSSYQSEEDARRTLLDHLEGAPLTEPRLLKFTTGRRVRAWEKNCIAVGLSGGFIEPLESTSIHLIQIGITRLMQLFPFGGIGEAVVARYNEQSRIEYERIRDFIALHYKVTQRDDSEFWRDCRAMDIPDSLAQRIELFRESALAYQATDEMFRVESWVQVMLGQGIRPASYHHMGRMLGPERLRKALETHKSSIAGAVARMPTHRQFLSMYCAAAP